MKILNKKPFESIEQPLISVVMPVYNMQQYVSEAIESILNQTYIKFEFIIIDDASTDNSWNIIQSYVDERIIALRNKENIGNYPARNKGMKIANGKYIAVMDSDDISLPDRLEKQSRLMEDHEYILACGSAYKINESNRAVTYPLKYEKIKYCLMSFLCLLHPSLMLRSDILNEIGLYDEEYIYSSDYDLICKLSNAGEIVNIEEPLLIHRVHEKQISSYHFQEQDCYARKIQHNYQLNLGLIIPEYDETFLRHLASYIEAMSMFSFPGLFYGKIGMTIFFFKYANFLQEEKYSVLALTLLQEVIQEINKEMPVNLSEGLSGIALTILYLLDNNLITGNPDIILKEIDEMIVQESFVLENDLSLDTGIAGVIIYIYCRLFFYRTMDGNLFDQLYLDKLLLVAKKIIHDDCSKSYSDIINRFVRHSQGESISLDWSEVLNLIITPLPQDEKIANWFFGLRSGCAGLGCCLIDKFNTQ